MRIISEPSLATDSLIAASTNQTIVPSSSPSSSASSFSPNSDPGMPTTTFHPSHNNNNNNHNHRPSSQPPVIHQQPKKLSSQNVSNAGGSDLKAADDTAAATFFIRGERSQPAYQHPPPPPISLLANNQGYIPFASEFYTTDQGYFMPQELCAAHAPICLHSEYGKTSIKHCQYLTLNLHKWPLTSFSFNQDKCVNIRSLFSVCSNINTKRVRQIHSCILPFTIRIS